MTNAATPMSATPASGAWVLRLWDRRAAFVPFAVAGAVSVVVGGVAAAATARTTTVHGTWAVAYLVLILGVSQIALGAGLALFPATQPASPMVVTASTAFNVANIAVLTGNISGHPLVLYGGAALLVAALGLFLYGVRHSARRGWPLYAYRLFVAALATCIPIGLLLAAG